MDRMQPWAAALSRLWCCFLIPAASISLFLLALVEVSKLLYKASFEPDGITDDGVLGGLVILLPYSVCRLLLGYRQLKLSWKYLNNLGIFYRTYARIIRFTSEIVVMTELVILGMWLYYGINTIGGWFFVTEARFAFAPMILYLIIAPSLVLIWGPLSLLISWIHDRFCLAPDDRWPVLLLNPTDNTVVSV